MKNSLLAILVVFGTTTLGAQSGGVIILEGNYQGKNIYVQNPFTSNGVGFCVSEVKVNGNITTDEVNSSAFEIDMKPHKLNVGEKVEIKIYHKEDCKPKVLNPEVLKPKSTYEIISMSVEKDGTFSWSTKSETGKLTFAIEQYRWNKWVKVGEVEGVGTPVTNNYSFKIVPHSGKNMLRVRQTDYTGQPRVSKAAEFESDVPPIVFGPQKASKSISFEAKGSAIETMYEI
ncbi:MAG: hypothetical protein AB7O73_14525 [Bacteroidia bacterium]